MIVRKTDDFKVFVDHSLKKYPLKTRSVKENGATKNVTPDTYVHCENDVSSVFLELDLLNKMTAEEFQAIFDEVEREN